MLVEFKVRNFLSINEMQVLRMRRTDADGNESGSDCAFIYGPNSSGKSNLIKAMDFSRKMILGKKVPSYKPHLDLNNNYTSDSPSYFEYIFELDGLRFSYGFEVDLIQRGCAVKMVPYYYRQKNIKSSISCEWLYLLTPEKDYKIFEISFGYEKKANPNGLVLGRITFPRDDFVKSLLHGKDEIEKEVLNMFRDNYLIRLSETDAEYTPVPKGIIRYLRDNLRRFDTGISDVVVEEFRKREIPENLIKDFKDDMTDDDQIVFINGNSRKRYWLIHIAKDGKETRYYEIRFRHGSNYRARIDEESIGTRKIMQLLTLLASQMVMDNKGVIAVDEIECSIHALAIEEFVKMFKQPLMKGAQLIFTTHQQKLLSEGCSVPDDIWFMDSVFEGDDKHSKLYALRSYEGDLSGYADMYLDGRFAAIPMITSFDLGDDK